MTDRISAKGCAKAFALLASLNLGACVSGGGHDVSETLELGIGMASLGIAAAQVASGANTGVVTPAYPVVQGSGNPGTYVAPRGNGYSQKGAFDDCAKLYASAGAKSLEAECRRRSSNMSSLR